MCHPVQLNPASTRRSRALFVHLSALYASKCLLSHRFGADALGQYVRINAAHPEIFHFIVDVGRHDDDRLAWLIDTHLRQRFEQFADLIGVSPREDAVHLYYAVVGAASLIFALGPECRSLSGVDPSSPQAVDTHIDVLLQLFGGAARP